MEREVNVFFFNNIFLKKLFNNFSLSNQCAFENVHNIICQWYLMIILYFKHFYLFTHRFTFPMTMEYLAFKIKVRQELLELLNKRKVLLKLAELLQLELKFCRVQDNK